MCNVCVAGEALATTACRNADCKALADGYQVAWTTAPAIDFKKALSSRHRGPKSSRKPRRRVSMRDRAFALGLPERPTVFVRARGNGPETRGEFQVRRQGESWPKKWQKTDDMASAMSMYGLDIKWRRVPKLVQAWARFEASEMPTLDALYDARDSQRASAGRMVLHGRPKLRSVRRNARARVRTATNGKTRARSAAIRARATAKRG